jgi:soluble lytic murein transglycosylase-like protein
MHLLNLKRSAKEIAMKYKKLMVGSLWVAGLMLVNQSEKDSIKYSQYERSTQLAPVIATKAPIVVQKKLDVDYSAPIATITSNPNKNMQNKRINTKDYCLTQSKLYPNIPLSARFQSWIDMKCGEKGISTNVVMGVIKKESNFRISAMGDNGEAYGLMQIQKKWHRARMQKVGAEDLLNCYDNVNVGIDYLAELYKANGCNWHKTLMAYNGGQAYANKKTSTYYSRKVMEYAEQYKKERRD